MFNPFKRKAAKRRAIEARNKCRVQTRIRDYRKASHAEFKPAHAKLVQSRCEQLRAELDAGLVNHQRGVEA